MTADRSSSDPPPGAPRLRLSRGSVARTLLDVERSLAGVERELRVQFTRIAHLQGELNLLLTALRRATDAHAMNLSFGACDGGPSMEAAAPKLVTTLVR